MTVATLVLGAPASGVLAWWAATRRTGKRRVESTGRLSGAQADWWRAVRSYASESASFAFRLRAYGNAAFACSKALETVERDGDERVRWQGPPPQPRELRPGAQRPGPADRWHRFDQAYEACYQLLHPADDCFALGQAAISLAEWLERHKPTMAPEDPVAESPADETKEYAGPDAAFIHAVSAPCLAGATADCVLREDGELRIDAGALDMRIDEHGTSEQRTMMALAGALIGRGDEGPTVRELLTLEDSDLCQALEAIALARQLRRVYPAQRPELLWMQAALTESGPNGGEG